MVIKPLISAIMLVCFVGAITLFGCGDSDSVAVDDSPPPPHQPVRLEAEAEPAFPMSGVADVVTYADQVAVFSVVSERHGEPEGEAEPYIPRYVRIRIERNLWTGERGTGPNGDQYVMAVGDTVEMLTWGSVEGGEPRSVRELTAFGEPRLEVGQTYVAGLFLSQGERGTYPGTVALADGDFAASSSENLLFDGDEERSSLASIEHRLASASPDPKRTQTDLSDGEFFALDPFDRMLSIARSDRSGEVVSDTSLDTSVPSTSDS